jgi:hypothetical protein
MSRTSNTLMRVALSALCLLGMVPAAGAQEDVAAFLEQEESSFVEQVSHHSVCCDAAGAGYGCRCSSGSGWPGFGNGSPFYGTVSLNQDAFFGFNAELAAGYAINDVVDFTFYSILWTTPSFATPPGGGGGLWTEVGAGLNFNLLDGTLTVNPQLGILNGALLSSTMADRALAFEGIVPNITVNHNDTFTEGEFYLGYYLATRSPRDNDFLHWWIYGGVKPWGESDDWRQIISTGVHFEQLRTLRSKTIATGDIYLWLGPYVQFSLPNDLALWFGAGWDVSSGQTSDFYKASISYSF